VSSTLRPWQYGLAHLLWAVSSAPSLCRGPILRDMHEAAIYAAGWRGATVPAVDKVFIPPSTH
jgi:hypothetical protein